CWIRGSVTTHPIFLKQNQPSPKRSGTCDSQKTTTVRTAKKPTLGGRKHSLLQIRLTNSERRMTPPVQKSLTNLHGLLLNVRWLQNPQHKMLSLLLLHRTRSLTSSKTVLKR